MTDTDAVYEMTIDQPSHPKGEPLQIDGLGTFDNGYTYTISRAEADAFRVHGSRQVFTTGANDGEILGADTVELGPTLLQASKNMHGVTVTTFDSSKEQDPNVRSNRHHATTTGDDDTSSPNVTDAVADADTPKMDKGGTDAQPKATKSDKGGAS